MDRITDTVSSQHPICSPWATTRGPAGTRGFTLIELLVVISIIALLVGILLPALGAARKTAQNSQCLSNIRQMDTAAMSFAADHQFFIQLSSSDSGWGTSGIPTELRGKQAAWVPPAGTAQNSNRIADWLSAQVPYMGSGTDFENADPKTSKAFICPSDGNQDTEEPGYIVYNNISAGPTGRKPASYGVNAEVTTYNDGAKDDGRGNWLNNGVPIAPIGGPPVNGSLDAIRSTSKTMLFADCGTRKNNNRPASGAQVYTDGEVLMYHAGTVFSSTDPEEEGTLAVVEQHSLARSRIPLKINEDPEGSADRHGDKINVAFADGHAAGHAPDNFTDVYVSPHK